MTTGTVRSYDPKTGDGYVRPDGIDHDVPFETDKGLGLRPGDRITFKLVGYMTGEMGLDVRPADA